MIISHKTREKKWAILTEQGIDRIELYPPFAVTKIGNIYSGTIASIKPSLQAAFVQFDHGPKGYLPLKSIPEQYGSVHQGMRMPVQVKKDEEATKGPVLTADLEFQGKYMVYFPFTKMLRLSKKISSQQRSRLQQWGEGAAGSEGGLLIRTDASSASDADLSKELSDLKQASQQLNQSFHKRKGQYLLKSAEPFIEEVKEAIINQVPDEIVTDTADMSADIKNFMSALKMNASVTFHHDDEDLFRTYIKEDIHHLMTRKYVWLDGGSQIVIDSLEALTVIDVNSSKQAGAKQHQAAAKDINMKAAAESLRQMRIRDLHGIILIDFINMKNPADRADIDRLIRQEAKLDPKHIHPAGFTELGLYQLTRKKTKASYEAAYTVPCPVCAGKGHVLSPESRLLELEKELLEKRRSLQRAEIGLTKDLHELIRQDPSFIKWIEQELKIPVTLIDIEHPHSYYQIR
ncbi:ribonuclease E [Jeotgalibacillus alimentarius]|uniref:Ribonuclease E n=1 Tax=Jeotgalibacillus alimentarius TaxID=135826 RepID=A0A0C2VWU7_9BACL|nr:ribonuclease E/G [Jeotgalibacillus alimentarius]KIL53347.1 ribonuclease E [Jeotgalibacillus alimentarius]